MTTAGAVKAARAYTELFVDDSELQRGLKSGQAKIQAFGRSLQSVARNFAAVGAALTAPILGAVKVFIDAGDRLDKMAKRTGFAVESLSKLNFAASQSGTSLEALEAALRGVARFTESVRRESAEAVDTLSALGLTFDDIEGKSPEQLFRLLATRLSNIDDPTRRSALAMQAFGKSGTALIPMLGDVNALMDQAESRGLVITTEQAESAAKLGDALDVLKGQMTQIAVQVGSAVAPALVALSEDMASLAGGAAQWVEANAELVPLILKLGAGALAASVALSAIANVVMIGGPLLAGISTLLTLLANPVFAALLFVGGIIAAVAFTQLDDFIAKAAEAKRALEGLPADNPLVLADKQKDIDARRAAIGVSGPLTPALRTRQLTPAERGLVGNPELDAERRERRHQRGLALGAAGIAADIIARQAALGLAAGGKALDKPNQWVQRNGISEEAIMNFLFREKQTPSTRTTTEASGTFSGDARQFGFVTGGKTLEQSAQEQTTQLEEINQALDTQRSILEQGLAMS